MACHCESGSRPWVNDALTMLARQGRSKSTCSRTRNVGTAPSEQDVTGDVMMIRRTSLGVHDRNDGSDDAA